MKLSTHLQRKIENKWMFCSCRKNCLNFEHNLHERWHFTWKDWRFKARTLSKPSKLHNKTSSGTTHEGVFWSRACCRGNTSLSRCSFKSVTNQCWKINQFQDDTKQVWLGLGIRITWMGRGKSLWFGFKWALWLGQNCYSFDYRFSM